MKTMWTIVLCLILAIPSFAEQPKESPDPILVALKARLEHEFQQLDTKPTYEFPDDTGGRILNVRFKTKNYVIHPTTKLGRAERTEKREGPTDGGFRIYARVQPLGEVNQVKTPQVSRGEYWDSYRNVYPVKNSRKQIYVCLDFNGSTDKTLIERIKKIVKRLSSGENN